jgi:hypothetical protein
MSRPLKARMMKLNRPDLLVSFFFAQNERRFEKGGWKPTNLTSVFNIRVNAISVVPSGSETDVHRANTDVRWVGFHPL